MSIIPRENLLEAIRESLDQAESHRQRAGRPFCTLTYAQSLDGCIALSSTAQMSLSGQESLTLTHHLRSWHDAILVGIRTVVSDNPRLNVRLVSGQNPQPVVLDSRLRIPLECRLLSNGTVRPWIAAGEAVAPERERAVEALGAKVLRLPTDKRGWVALDALLDRMAGLGVRSLMVEGGARVLTSFMRARLVDQVIVTVAPVMAGGVHAFRRLTRDPALVPSLSEVRYAQFGKDMVVWGQPRWGKG